MHHIHVHLTAQMTYVGTIVGLLLYGLFVAVVAASGSFLRAALIGLFGKVFFRWEGRRFVKEEKLNAQLDTYVAEDSVEQLAREIAELREEREHATEYRRKKDLSAQIDGREEQLIQVRNKLVEYRQKMINLDYKLQLLKRL